MARLLIDGIDRAEHAPLSRARDAADGGVKNALPAAALRQVEAGEQKSPKAKADRGDPGDRRVGFQRDEHEQADNRERKLGCRLEQNIDDDACCRERAGNGVTRQQPRADEIAADLCHGQQDIGGLPDVPQQDACPQLRARLRRKNQPPARPGDRNRDAAHRHNEENSPPDAGNRMAHRIEARPRHDSDDGGDPDQPGGHTGLLDHLRSDSTQGLAASGGQLSARTGRQQPSDADDRCPHRCRATRAI